MIKAQPKDLSFGDYVTIRQKRYGTDDEGYTHKVIGASESNCWVSAPVESPRSETRHSNIVPVVECICCGVDETKVLKYRRIDVQYCEHGKLKANSTKKDSKHFHDVLTDSFTRPVKIERFECPKCGWYADIPDDQIIAFFSREYCPTCRTKLNKLSLGSD